MAKSRSGGWLRSEIGGLPIWGALGLGLVVVILAGVGVIAAIGRDDGDPTRAAYTPSYAASISHEDEALSGLHVMNEALMTGADFSLAVLGDSTGDEAGEWVSLMADEWSTSATVTLHMWNVGSVSYDPAIIVGSGTQQIEIWNGSAGGKNTQYSIDHIAELMPEPVDFIVINHAHNEGRAADLLRGVEALMTATSAIAPGGEDIIIAQNPNRTGDTTGQSDKVLALAGWASQRGIDVVDVYSAFINSGDPDSLLADNQHPSDAGSALWWETFREALVSAN